MLFQSHVALLLLLLLLIRRLLLLSQYADVYSRPIEDQPKQAQEVVCDSGLHWLYM
jgi:hypothetical protein